MDSQPANSIFPVILTYAISTLLVLTYVFRQHINLYKALVTLSSFLFISSGFFVQIGVSNHSKLKYFFEEWGKVISSPPMTVLATALGIFLGNMLLKFFSSEKERKETSIVLINGLEAHIRALSMISFYLSSGNINVATHQIYLTKIRENKSYEKALMEIGKFRDDETDVLSKYESYLWTTLINIERNLNSSNIPIVYSQLNITATITYAMLCSYILAQKHCPSQKKEQEQSFLRDFPKVTQWLIEHSPLECNDFIRMGFVDVLIDIRKRYQTLNRDKKAEQINSLKILYLPLGIIGSGGGLELMVFGTSFDEMKDCTRQYLNKNPEITAQEIEKMMVNSQTKMLSPWN
jgi:hypothetical protein